MSLHPESTSWTLILDPVHMGELHSEADHSWETTNQCSATLVSFCDVTSCSVWNKPVRHWDKHVSTQRFVDCTRITGQRQCWFCSPLFLSDNWYLTHSELYRGQMITWSGASHSCISSESLWCSNQTAHHPITAGSLIREDVWRQEVSPSGCRENFHTTDPIKGSCWGTADVLTDTSVLIKHQFIYWRLAANG